VQFSINNKTTTTTTTTMARLRRVMQAFGSRRTTTLNQDGLQLAVGWKMADIRRRRTAASHRIATWFLTARAMGGRVGPAGKSSHAAWRVARADHGTAWQRGGIRAWHEKAIAIIAILYCTFPQQPYSVLSALVFCIRLRLENAEWPRGKKACLVAQWAVKSGSPTLSALLQ
jgi:hypothetical protein